MEYQQCCVCYEIKLVDDYYPYARNQTGIMAACKECHNARTMRANRKYRDKRRAQRKRYNDTPERRKAAYENTKKMYALYPEHQKARMKVYNAVKAGKLHKLPCSVCGEIKVQAHHNDYTRPLEVLWVCVPHHKIIHSK